MKFIVGGCCVALMALGGCALGGCASSTAPASASAVHTGAGAAPDAVTHASNESTPTASAAAGDPSRTLAMSAGPALEDQVIATVNGRSISMGQLLNPLLESHGLTMLLSVVQLELAKQALEEQHLSITPEDVAKERDRTLSKMFLEYDQTMDEKIAKAEKNLKAPPATQPHTDKAAPTDWAAEIERLKKEKEESHAQLLEQFFTQQRITPAEFDILMQTNACLRKFTEPLAAGKITDAMILKEFNQRFGESVRVRHIQLARPQDRWEAERRLQAGEPFEKVAREMSTNRQTGPLGGQLPPFTMADAHFPENFKKAAFALKVGETTMVDADNAYHLIKLDGRIQPRAVKLQDQHDIILRDLNEMYVQALMRELREKIGGIARTKLKIDNAILERQFKQRLASLDAEVKSKEEALKKMNEENKLAAEERAALERAAATRPSTRPDGLPAGGPGEPPHLKGATLPTTLPIITLPETQPSSSSRGPAHGTIEGTMRSFTQPTLPPPADRPLTGPAWTPAPVPAHAPAPAPAPAPPAPATRPAGPATTQPAGSQTPGR